MTPDFPEATTALGYAIKAFEIARDGLTTFADAFEAEKERASKEEMELWGRVFRRVLPAVQQYVSAAESELYRVCSLIEECVGAGAEDDDVAKDMDDILARVRKLDDEDEQL